MNKKERETFIKEAKNWIKERTLQLEEDLLSLDYYEKIIKNLVKQKKIKTESVKHQKKRILNYVKYCHRLGYKEIN